MQSNEIKNLSPTLLWQYFYEITQIPRPSKKEEKIRKYVREFAEKNNFFYKEDKVGNIVINVPATKGYENHEIVILQGHIDMVCEKNNDKIHDFENDPLTVYVDGDWVTADGTTLGADNGIGVAAAMAIATDPNAEHGPLELLMTIDEETGMTGANEISTDFLKGNILLNLDSEEDGAFYVGCSGGVDTMGKVSVKFEENSTDYLPVKIEVTNLLGGHSGLDIHRGRANAIRLLAQFLTKIGTIDHKLVTINGGSLRNAIPREAEVTVLINKSDLQTLKNLAENFQKEIRKEYNKKDLEAIIRVTELSEKVEKFINDEDARKIVLLLNSLPHGVCSMSADIENLVETSTNLATIRLTGNELIISTSQRSSNQFAKENIATKVASIFELAGAEIKKGDGYPGWLPNMDSKILKLGKEIFEKNFSKKPEIKAIHAGLECGIFSSKFPKMDMISFGPTIEGAHSPHERVNINDVDKFYTLLKNMLIKI